MEIEAISDELEFSQTDLPAIWHGRIVSLGHDQDEAAASTTILFSRLVCRHHESDCPGRSEAPERHDYNCTERDRDCNERDSAVDYVPWKGRAGTYLKYDRDGNLSANAEVNARKGSTTVRGKVEVDRRFGVSGIVGIEQEF